MKLERIRPGNRVRIEVTPYGGDDVEIRLTGSHSMSAILTPSEADDLSVMLAYYARTRLEVE